VESGDRWLENSQWVLLTRRLIVRACEGGRSGARRDSRRLEVFLSSRKRGVNGGDRRSLQESGGKGEWKGGQIVRRSGGIAVVHACGGVETGGVHRDKATGDEGGQKRGGEKWGGRVS